MDVSACRKKITIHRISFVVTLASTNVFSKLKSARISRENTPPLAGIKNGNKNSYFAPTHQIQRANANGTLEFHVNCRLVKSYSNDYPFNKNKYKNDCDAVHNINIVLSLSILAKNNNIVLVHYDVLGTSYFLITPSVIDYF